MSAHTVLSNGDTLCYLVQFLEAFETARLSGVCQSAYKLIRANDADIWGPRYEKQWGSSAPRGPFDSALPLAILYARKVMRKYAPVSAFVQLNLANPADVHASHEEEDLKPDARAHKTRLRADSAEFTSPERAAAAQADNIGAMRSVQLSRGRVLYAASDQGHIAAWDSPWRTATGSFLPGLQGDAFAWAIGAKSRRDAKRKYSNTAVENKFVYFKVHRGEDASLDLWDRDAVPGSGKQEMSAPGISEHSSPTPFESLSAEATRSVSPVTSGSRSVASCAESDSTDVDTAESTPVASVLSSSEHSRSARKRSGKKGGRESTHTSSPILGSGESVTTGRSKWSDADRMKLEEREARRRAKRGSNSTTKSPITPSPKLPPLDSATPMPPFSLGPAADDTTAASIDLSVASLTDVSVEKAGGDAGKRFKTGPKGSRLRSDVWFLTHWTRDEPYVADKPVDDTYRGKQNAGTGSAVSFRAVVVFPDGDAAVLLPSAISTRAVDWVYRMRAVGELTLQPTQQLLLPSKPKKTSLGMPTLWPHGSVTWLEKPISERKDSIRYGRCVPGATYVLSSTSVRMDPDVISLCFGRAVGVWMFRAQSDRVATAEPGDMDMILQPVSIFRGHVTPTTACAIHAPHPEVGDITDDSFLANLTLVSGDEGGEIHLWNAQTMRKMSSMTIAGRGVKESVVVLEMNATVIAAGGQNGSVSVWRRRDASGKPAPPELIAREMHAHNIVRMIHLPQKHCGVTGVLTAGGDGDVRLWCTVRCSGKQYSSKSPSITPIGGGDSTASEFICKLLRGHTSRIVGLHMDNWRIVTASLDGVVKIWDLQEPHVGRLLHSTKFGHEISSLWCSHNALWMGTVDGSLIYVRLKPQQQMQQQAQPSSAKREDSARVQELYRTLRETSAADSADSTLSFEDLRRAFEHG